MSDYGIWNMRLPINIDDVLRGQTVEYLSIANYPGPDRSIDLEDLRNGRGVTRRYRNRAEPEKTGTETQSKSQSKSKREPLQSRICQYLKTQDATAAEISEHLKQKQVSGQLKIVLKEMVIQGLIEYYIPDKPRSRFQKYRLTEKGNQWLNRGVKSGSTHATGDQS